MINNKVHVGMGGSGIIEIVDIMEDPRWSNDINFCIEQLENEVGMDGNYRYHNKGMVYQYIKYLNIKVVDNPNRETTINNLYKKKIIMENLK